MTEHIQYSPEKDALVLLDQRYLPTREEWFVCKTVNDICEALVVMVVRGAPAIGVTAAYGCYLAAREVKGLVPADGDWKSLLAAKLEQIALARPTAVNLRWAVRLMQAEWAKRPEFSLDELSAFWLAKAKVVHAEDIKTCMVIGQAGMDLLSDGDTVMTHCNAGALATAGYGTALAPIRAAVAQGKKIQVIANETRPFLQGARLTAYELYRDGIPVKVACDNACALLMQRGLVQKVIVGADRIAANGDAANKIGTYSVAILAKEHKIPFYVAAPSSTFDLSIPDGSHIPIEERAAEEVTQGFGRRTAPEGCQVYCPAFDVTPARYIAAIITERGLIRKPTTAKVAKHFKK